MTVPLVNLAEIRTARDEAVKTGRAMAERLSGSVAASVERWADRAAAVSIPLLSTDAEMARAVDRWAARRLRAEVLRTLIDLRSEGQADLVATAEAAFTTAMVALANRHADGADSSR